MLDTFRNALTSVLGYETTVHTIPDPAPADANGTPPLVIVHKLDWESFGLYENNGRIALVIDNVFSTEDCEKLLRAAEESKRWEVAAVHGGPGDENGYVDTDYRNSSRILLDDHNLAAWILEKLRPYIQDVEFAPKSDRRSGRVEEPATEWQLSRLNERLRYLQYTKGQYFRPHCDGSYYTPDRSEVSYYTLQLYLDGSADTLAGGATRFKSWRHRKEGDKFYADVAPRTGRALIFQQTGLLHSGEEVQAGTKVTIRTDLMYKRVPEIKPLAEADAVAVGDA